jgi:hypothetical protein
MKLTTIYYISLCLLNRSYCTMGRSHTNSHEARGPVVEAALIPLILKPTNAISLLLFVGEKSVVPISHIYCSESYICWIKKLKRCMCIKFLMNIIFT